MFQKSATPRRTSASASASTRRARHVRPVQNVVSTDLKVIQNRLKKGPSIHFVNGLNVSQDIIDSKVVYVFKDPLQADDKLVQIKQGVLASVTPNTLHSLKKQLDLYFEVYTISNTDFKLYLLENNTNGLVMYNAYSNLSNRNTYFLYFDIEA